MSLMFPGGKPLFDIDSQEARRLARRIRSIADDISSLRSRDIAPIKGIVRDELSGRTADKLTQAIRSIEGDVNSLVASLNEIASSLTAYARRLESLDKEASGLIRRK